MQHRTRLWAAILLFGCAVSVVMADDEFSNPKANIPPKAAPQRRNAGEGVPPLPLPATPLRRSEKKREPSPPALVGSITFADIALKKAGINWETTVIDIEKWVSFTNDQLGQRYRFVGTDFAKFSYDPTELPILYFTGWKKMPALDDGTIEHLRQYLMDGGTLVVHSNCGRPEFNKSFEHEIARVFPDRVGNPPHRRRSLPRPAQPGATCGFVARQVRPARGYPGQCLSGYGSDPPPASLHHLRRRLRAHRGAHSA